MLKLFLLQESIERLSFLDPPGCIIADMPDLFAISTQSGKGKASEAITELFKSMLNLFALLIACFSASTLEVCPHPDPISCLLDARTSCIRFSVLTYFTSNNKSSICFLEGFFQTHLIMCPRQL